MMNFYKMLFLNSMIIGSIISISSLSWLTMWVGLEINLLSLMPLMKMFNNKYSSESTIKYFMIQVMSSSLFLFSIMLFNNSLTLNKIMLPNMILSSTILLKMGAAPFHFWLPEVLSGLSWQNNLIILTWQKIAPFILLSYMNPSPMYMSIIIMLSSIIGGLGGLNQMCMRKMLAYSSINHMSWMISAMMCSINTWLYYIMIYSIINLNLIIIFNKFNFYYMNQLSNLLSFNKKIKFFFMLNFLSLGGLPPFLGFFPKWMVVNLMINNNYYTLMVIIIMSTLLTLYFYTRIALSSFTIYSEETILFYLYKINYFIMMINFISIFSLIMIPLITNMY